MTEEENRFRTPFYDVWRRFRKSRLAMFGLTIVILLIVIATFADVISPFGPYFINFTESLKPPSSAHLLGTDVLGRDLLSRIIYGTRTSLFVGLTSSFIALIIGIILGSLSGYYGGFVDFLAMRFTDVFLCIPSYFLYILVLAIFRVRSLYIMTFVLGLFMWPRLARIIRSEFLSLKEQEYIKAAKALGAGDFRIIFRHILPNCIASIIVVSTLNVAIGILMESALSFLGLGDPTVCSWGIQLGNGRKFMMSAWWLSTFPGIAIFITALSFNLLGDGLRDSLDPRLRGRV